MSEQLETDLFATDAKNMVAAELVNIPQNITPGYSNTPNNPGEMFDPQVKVQGANVDTTFASDELLKLDDAARLIIRLRAYFPSESSDNTYNARLDKQLGDALKTCAESLEDLKNERKPRFDASSFYDFDPHDYDPTQPSNPQKVKKVGAEWLAQKPAGIANPVAPAPYPPHPAAQFNWTFTVANPEAIIGTGRRRKVSGYKPDITVDVTVDVPVSAWEHIYDRHWIPTFAGEIKPVNTFWRQDPVATIDQAMLEPEVKLLIDRRLDLLSINRNQEAVYDLGIDEPATRLFFQGTINVTVNRPSNLSVEFTVKSIAPQHQDLGQAVEPLTLR